METNVDGRGGFPPDDEITRDYQIVRLLGKGGMGEVYLAEQVRVGRRRVALKLIRSPHTEDPGVVRRFENEASAAGRLEHENIVRIYDCRSTTAGRIYVAMEYVEGQTLKKFISARGSLPLPTIVEIIGQVCSGLGAAHRAEIVHRDIKPDNIMIAERGGHPFVKILDFGIARLAGGDSSLTSSGVVMGSAAYMAPEQAAGLTGDKIDARADVYSTAMVVYEMLTGVAPFKSGSWAEAIHRQRYETPSPPGSLRPGLPREVDRVIMKALSKEPGQRHQSIDAFYEELRAAVGPGSSPPAQEHIQNPAMVVPAAPPVLPLVAGAGPPQEAAAVAGEAKEEHLSAMNRIRLSWSMLPLALKWLLVIILIPVLINLVTMRHGESMMGWIERMLRIGGQPANTNNGPTPQPSVQGPAPTPGGGGAQPRTLVGLVEFRAVLETPRNGLDTLSADNELRSGEAVHFLFKLSRPGSVYLMHEREDGFLEWLNSEKQEGPVGSWLQVPENKEQVIAADDQPGAEKFLLIYVPRGSDWTPAKAISPQAFIDGEGVPTIPKEAAARLRESLRSAGVEMTSTATRFERAVTHKLVGADAPDKPVFHEFHLRHTR